MIYDVRLSTVKYVEIDKNQECINWKAAEGSKDLFPSLVYHLDICLIDNVYYGYLCRYHIILYHRQLVTTSYSFYIHSHFLGS